MAFGDKDRECVEFERDDYRGQGWKASDLKIVTFARVPTQAQCDLKTAELNAAERKRAPSMTVA